MADTARQLTPYEFMGGAEAVRRLADRFYELMDTQPDYAALRAMHEDDLAPMRERLFAFLSGWLGGPRLYGGCVVSAHARLTIGQAESDQWLACIARAMDDTEVPEDVRALVQPVLARMCDGMLRG
jgi:hemoglobin